MADETDRADVSDNSVAVMLPIPAEIAAQFPDLGKSMPPHVTLVYVGEVDPAKVEDVVLVVADEVHARWSDLGRDPSETERYLESPDFVGHMLALGALGYFENDPRVAYASVIAPPALHEARRRLIDRFIRIGLAPTHADHWVPHATLAFLPPGDAYTGEVPKGQWESGAVEVWHGNDTRYLLGKGSASGVDKIAKVGAQWRAWRSAGKTLVGDFGSEAEARVGLLADAVDRELTGRWDRLGRKGEKWVALSEDGETELGTYETEDKARERLRQVEAAKAAKAKDDGATDMDGSGLESPAQQVLFDVSPDGSVVLTRADGPVCKITIDPSGQVEIHARNEAEAEVAISSLLAERRDDAILNALGLDRSGTPPPPQILGWSRAPAVHTESRVHVAEVIRADRISLPTDHAPIRHPHGWVLYPVLYSRAGNIQVYDGIREYRPREEVFARASMDSGIGDPWELRHSKDLLSPNTVRGVARGCIVTVDEYHDGEHTFGWARAWDRSLLYAIEGDGVTRPEAPEVSVAYACKVDKRPGHDDYGNAFDQRQFDIVWNSLASEPYGRAQTAKVLTGRADAEPITVQGAGDLLALASGARPPASPVVFDRGSWARFDSRSMTRPSLPLSESPRKDQSVNTTHNLILAAQKLGVADDAIAGAIGLDLAALAALLDGDDQLTPDQINALLAILPVGGAMAPPAEGATDAGDMAKVMIGEAEFEVPKAVAEHIKSLEAKMQDTAAAVQDAKGRADRATKRADAAEAKLAAAEAELTKRADAIATMVTRADAEAMVTTYGKRIADAMDLVRRVHGHEYTPEARKDADTQADLPLTTDDWERAAIRSAFGDKADAVLARIDAAPNAAARDYAMAERLADARELVDKAEAARTSKRKDAIEAVGRMRTENAHADHQDADAKVAAMVAARQAQIQAAGQVRTAPTPNTQAPGVA